MPKQLEVTWLLGRIVTPLAEFVVAAPIADEDQRHQTDAQREGHEDTQNHRDPAGEADMRVADTEPRWRDDDEDGQNTSNRAT